MARSTKKLLFYQKSNFIYRTLHFQISRWSFQQKSSSAHRLLIWKRSLQKDVNNLFSKQIEAPSSNAERAKKVIHKIFKRPTKPPNNSPPAFNSKQTSSKKKNAKKKPVLCYKCGKPGHKAFRCRTEQKINELFAYQPELQKKLLALLA